MSKDQVNEPMRIRLSAETPLQYWCNLMDCEEKDLLQAIGIIGDSVPIVDYYLVLNRKKIKDR